MKIKTECVPCLIKRIIFEAEQSTNDPETISRVIRNACKLLGELYDPNECSITIATKVHKNAYETLGNNDPYKELKKQANEVASLLVPRVEEIIKNSDDPLKTSMICSIVGNMMDFGIDGGSTHPGMLKEIFEKTVADGLGHDDTTKFKELLKKSEQVVLFTDNCGEIVFDKILCREIKNFNPDLFLTLVVRGEPIISDATIQDAIEFGFEEVVDEILTTGCFVVGVDFANLPKKLENVLRETDLIICKGMANYEAFSETTYHPIVYLMRTKCNAIASSMGVKQDISVVKLYE